MGGERKGGGRGISYPWDSHFEAEEGKSGGEGGGGRFGTVEEWRAETRLWGQEKPRIATFVLLFRKRAFETVKKGNRERGWKPQREREREVS